MQKLRVAICVVLAVSCPYTFATDWETHKDWAWSKETVAGHAEAYTTSLERDDVFAVITFPPSERCHLAQLHLEGAQGNIFEQRVLKVELSGWDYEFSSDGGGFFNTVDLSDDMLRGLKSESWFSILRNGETFTFRLGGSARAINSVWRLCEDLQTEDANLVSTQTTDSISSPSRWLVATGDFRPYAYIRGIDDQDDLLRIAYDDDCMTPYMSLGSTGGSLYPLRDVEVVLDDFVFHFARHTVKSEIPLYHFFLSKLGSADTLTLKFGLNETRFVLNGASNAIEKAKLACEEAVSGGRLLTKSFNDVSPQQNVQGEAFSSLNPIYTLVAIAVVIGMIASAFRLAANTKQPFKKGPHSGRSNSGCDDKESERERKKNRERREQHGNQNGDDEASRHGHYRREQQRTDQHEQNNHDHRRPDDGLATLACPACDRKMRVSVSPTRRRGRCSVCSTEFSVFRDNEGHLHIESVRDVQSEDARFEIVTAEDCFRLLELPEESSREMIRAAYRARISAYHPDKVSSLGPHLRAVAESETKRLNQAMRILREHGYV